MSSSVDLHTLKYESHTEGFRAGVAEGRERVKTLNDKLDVVLQRSNNHLREKTALKAQFNKQQLSTDNQKKKEQSLHKQVEKLLFRKELG